MKNSIMVLSVLIGFLFCKCQSDPGEKYHEIFFDMERTTKDNKFLSIGNFIASNGGDASKDKFFSGKQSVVLSGVKEYGINVSLQNAAVGDKYELTVRRHKSNSKAPIVVSGETSDILYIAQTNPEKETIDQEWQLVKLVFTVPVSAKGQDLKIYLWNPEKTVPAYFDDFSIKFIEKVPAAK